MNTVRTEWQKFLTDHNHNPNVETLKELIGGLTCYGDDKETRKSAGKTILEQSTVEKDINFVLVKVPELRTSAMKKLRQRSKLSNDQESAQGSFQFT